MPIGADGHDAHRLLRAPQLPRLRRPLVGDARLRSLLAPRRLLLLLRRLGRHFALLPGGLGGGLGVALGARLLPVDRLAALDRLVARARRLHLGLGLLQRELGGALQKSDLAEQHLGLTLHEERAMIDKYLSLALSQTVGAAVR